MRDDVLPLAGAGMAFVMFFDPVGLEDDPVTRPDKGFRQLQRGERACDDRVNGLGALVVLRPEKTATAVCRQ